MDYVGLIQKFKINRPLTEDEREQRLRQKKRLEIDPTDQVAIIKINSTYLESVDRYYAHKGWLSLWMVVAIIMCVGIMLGSIFIDFTREVPTDDSWAIIALYYAWDIALFGTLFYVSLWGFRKEATGYTHYPIRLNRKTRMVHVFRQDGSVLSVPWDDVFFAIGRGMKPYGLQNWDVRGHVLADDGVTVKETFAFADVESKEIVTRHWEFLRRYMEDGPEAAYKKIKYCMPVDGRRETFKQSWWRLFEEEWFLPLRFLGYPLIVLAVCARWLAMRLGKVPVWPAEVEAVCVIDPDDPYIKDASDNPPDLR